MRGCRLCTIVASLLCALGGCVVIPKGISSRGTTGGVQTASVDPSVAKRSKLWHEDRLDKGYILILPGSWGETAADHGIVNGLVDANIDSAIEIYAWPVGDFPAGILMVPYNLRASDRNHTQARQVAAKIVAYKEKYPDRPVHLIGYSGGGGIAVWALEALPPDTKVTSAVLLAPTLSYNYDFGPALCHIDRGIENFYSPYDVPVMMALCSIIGNTDGTHWFPGGAVGFRPRSAASPSDRETYLAQVHEHPYEFSMLAKGHAGGHFGWPRRQFVAAHVAPLIDPLAPSASPTPQVARKPGGDSVWLVGWWKNVK